MRFAVQKNPMAAQSISSRSHGHQNDGQPQVVAQAAPSQQGAIGDFVDCEARGRDDEEARRGIHRTGAVTRKTEAVVADERHAKGDQPAQDIGQQRGYAGLPDQQDDDAEVNRRRSAPDGDEPADPRLHRMALPQSPKESPREEPGRATLPGSPSAGRTPQGGLGGAHGGQRQRPRAIALCVDDFGLHAGVNEAALQLAGLGRASAIACLVGGPAWQADGWRLTGLDPAAVDIGLHLDFTECPLIAASRHSWQALVAGAYCGWLNPRRLRIEIDAQLDAFEDTLGRPPAFVDGHRHVHQLPLLRRVLLDALDHRGGPSRTWLRRTRCPVGGNAASPGWKSRLIEALGAQALSRLAACRGYAQNNHLLGVYDFRGGPERYAGLLRAWLAVACDADLLMCHPSLPVRAPDPLLPARASEFAVLAGSGFTTALGQAGQQLQPMTRLLACAR